MTILKVIEHVENPAEFIQNCLRVLKPRGSLFVSTMNRSRKSYAMAILGAEYVLGLVPPGIVYPMLLLDTLV